MRVLILNVIADSEPQGDGSRIDFSDCHHSVDTGCKRLEVIDIGCKRLEVIDIGCKRLEVIDIGCKRLEVRMFGVGISRRSLGSIFQQHSLAKEWSHSFKVRLAPHSITRG